MATCNMEVQDEKDKTQKHMVVNGLIGTVKDMNSESVWVAFENGQTVNIPKRKLFRAS